MKKPLGEMFRDYHRESTFGRCLSPDNKFSAFELQVAMAMIHESAKRTNKQTHAGLLRDATYSVVDQHFERFVAYSNQCGVLLFLSDGTKETITNELTAVTPGLKRHIAMLLDWAREDMFESSDYQMETASKTVIEHAMLTFTRRFNELDVYFAGKSLAKRDFSLAKSQTRIISLLRVGNAVFEKWDWLPHYQHKVKQNE